MGTRYKRFEVRDSRGGFIGNWLAKDEKMAISLAKNAANRDAAVFRNQRGCTDFFFAQEVPTGATDMTHHTERLMGGLFPPTK